MGVEQVACALPVYSRHACRHDDLCINTSFSDHDNSTPLSFKYANSAASDEHQFATLHDLALERLGKAHALGSVKQCDEAQTCDEYGMTTSTSTACMLVAGWSPDAEPEGTGAAEGMTD